MPNNHLLPDELAMRERCERATRPVSPLRYMCIIGMFHEPCGLPHECGEQCWDSWADAVDAELGHSRRDIPELLTRLAAERAEVERLRAELEKGENDGIETTR